MRIAAILTTYNEARFLPHILDHYDRHGIEVFILDNESTDDSVEIARSFLARNVIAVETLPRKGYQDWVGVLKAKEDVADRIKADWFIHADPDEFRLPPSESETLRQAIERVDAEGFNAVNFFEFTFLPTKEAPDHDHPDFLDTMRHYYPFCPSHPNRLNGWKHPQNGPGLKKRVKTLLKKRTLRCPTVDLVSSGGHRVQFEGLKMWPKDFKMRHYIVLSLDHAIRKYVKIKHNPNDPEGYHGFRKSAAETDFLIPSQSELRRYEGDDALDPSDPKSEHIFVQKMREAGQQAAE